MIETASRAGIPSMTVRHPLRDISQQANDGMKENIAAQPDALPADYKVYLPWPRSLPDARTSLLCLRKPN